MSTDRRTFLAGAAALPAATLPAAAGEPDPVFAAIAAEREAQSIAEAASAAYSRAEEALFASEWDRQPRVLVGFAADTADPSTMRPVYLHTDAEIRAEFDARRARAHTRHRGWTAERMMAVLREFTRQQEEAEAALVADMLAIEAAPAVVAEAEAERAADAAVRVWGDAFLALAGTVPTTDAGLRALLARLIEVDAGGDLLVNAGTMRAALHGVATFVMGGRA